MGHASQQVPYEPHSTMLFEQTRLCARLPVAGQSWQHASVRPPTSFLKWAGGKRRLLPEITAEFPGEFGRYIEPFLGGGSVLFYVLWSLPGKPCLALDTNPDLIAAYDTIRYNVDGLITLLRGHEDRYRCGPEEYYYKVRAASPSDKTERAARMLFLNRTCFNGLYRVNSRGEFNVPFGRYANPNIANECVLRAASALLSSKRPSIKCGDFGAVADEASRGDLVYMDPPYYPTSKTASFTMYTRGDFGRRDLERLAGVCDELDSRGCRVLLSNSDVPEVRRLFRADRWRIRRLSVSRMINSDGSKRTGHSELLLKNF